MTQLGLEIDHAEIERLKEQRRRLWNYQRVDHIPVDVKIMPHHWSEVYTVRRRLEEFGPRAR